MLYRLSYTRDTGRLIASASTVQAFSTSVPRNRVWRRAAWACALSVAACLGGTMLVEAAPTWLPPVLRTLTGLEVHLGRVVVRAAPVRIEVDDVRVTDAADGEQLLAVTRAVVEPGMPAGRPGLRRLVLVRPDVLVRVGGASSTPASPAGRPELPDSFPWEELVVEEGRLSVVHPRARLDVVGLDVGPAPSRAGIVDVRLAEVTVAAGSWVRRATDVHIPRVSVSPARVVVPHLALVFPDLRIDGDLAWASEGPVSGAFGVEADLGTLLAARDGTAPVAGHVRVDVELSGTAAQPDLGGRWVAGPLEVDVDADTPLALGPHAARWRLEEGLAGWALRLEPLAMQWARGRLEVRGAVRVEDGVVDIDVLGRGLHLADVLRDGTVHPASWVDFAGDLSLSVQGTLVPLSMSGPFALGVRDLVVQDGPVDRRVRPRGTPPPEVLLAVENGHLDGTVRFDLEHLALDVAEASFRGRGGHHSEGRATADVGFADSRGLQVDVVMARLDLAQLAPLGGVGLRGIARVEGSVGGRWDAPFDARAQVEGRDLAVVDFPVADSFAASLVAPGLVDVRFEDLVGHKGRTSFSGSYALDFAQDEPVMTLDLDVDDGRLADLVGVVADLPGIDGRVSGRAELEGPVDRLVGRVDLGLEQVRLWSETFDRGQAHGWFDGGRFLLDAFDLRRAGGRPGTVETVLARGSIGAGWTLNLDAVWDGATLQRLDALAGLPASGDLGVDLALEGTFDDPRPRGRVRIADVAWDGTPIGDVRLDARTEDGVLSASGRVQEGGVGARGALDLTGTVQLAGVGPWAARVRAQDFPVHALWPFGMDGAPLGARLGGALTASGAVLDDAVPMTVDADVDSLLATWREHRIALDGPAGFRWRAESGRSALTVPRLHLVGRRGGASPSTDVTFGGESDADAVRYTGAGRVDLELARIVVPGLLDARGSADVRLDIGSGPDGAPAPVIDLTLRDAALLTEYLPAAFEGLSATVQARPDGYVVRNVAARLGGGRFASTESRIDAQDWVPTRYALAGTLQDGTVKYFDDLPPITGDARLRFDGPVGELLLSGDITVDRMEFRDRVDWESMVLSVRAERLTVAAPDETARYFAMDLGVVADGTVRIANNIADATASGRLRVLGDTQRPGVVGEITVAPGGRAFLHERTFDIARGEVRYVDPYTFDPQLDFVLDTTVRTTAQDVRVSYRVGGPFSDWRTETSSDPWLPQADVNALLLFGLTRAELERNGGIGTALVAETSDLLLAQNALTRFDGLVDRWSLVNGASERGSSMVNSELRLVAEKRVGDLDLTVEKSLGAGLGGDWYASVERRLAQRLYATGYVATRQEGRALPIGAAYGTEFKLRWEFDGD
ncbi:MAG: hypothetical protein RLZZ299_1681 [Pseudomonadota bacterium]